MMERVEERRNLLLDHRARDCGRSPIRFAGISTECSSVGYVPSTITRILPRTGKSVSWIAAAKVPWYFIHRQTYVIKAISVFPRSPILLCWRLKLTRSFLFFGFPLSWTWCEAIPQRTRWIVSSSVMLIISVVPRRERGKFIYFSRA